MHTLMHNTITTITSILLECKSKGRTVNCTLLSATEEMIQITDDEIVSELPYLAIKLSYMECMKHCISTLFLCVIVNNIYNSTITSKTYCCTLYYLWLYAITNPTIADRQSVHPDSSQLNKQGTGKELHFLKHLKSV